MSPVRFKRPRGVCQECGGEFSLTKTHSVRLHSLVVSGHFKYCDGSEQKPVAETVREFVKAEFPYGTPKLKVAQ